MFAYHGFPLVEVGALIHSSPPCRQWKTPYIPTLLAVSVVCFVAFWFYERHLERHTTSAPLMSTSLWFKGRFAVVQLIGALGWSAFASYMFFCSLAFQVRGLRFCARMTDLLVVELLTDDITFYEQDYMLLRPILATVRYLPCSITGFFLNVRAPKSNPLSSLRLDADVDPWTGPARSSSSPFWPRACRPSS